MSCFRPCHMRINQNCKKYLSNKFRLCLQGQNFSWCGLAELNKARFIWLSGAYNVKDDEALL